MNWLAIIIAAIANMIIGFLWYGTWAFGKSWMTLSGNALFEFSEGTTRTGELVERGSVIHFRSAFPIRIRALDASRLLRVTCSSVCTCGPQTSAST